MSPRPSSVFRRLLSFALLAAVLPAWAAAYVRTVSPGQGIYAKADETSKVATLPAGTVMAVRQGSVGQKGWIQVVAPDCVDCWIVGDFVKDGAVSVSMVRVRTAANSTAPEIARLQRGESVVERGRKLEWLKIAPPPSATLWVKAESVTASGEAAPASRPAPREEPEEEIIPPAPVLSPSLPAVTLPPAPAVVVTPTTQPPAPPTTQPPAPPAPVPPAPPVPAPIPVAVPTPTTQRVIVPAWQPSAEAAAPVPATRPAEPAPAAPPAPVPATHPVAVTPPTHPVAVAPPTRAPAAPPPTTRPAAPVSHTAPVAATPAMRPIVAPPTTQRVVAPAWQPPATPAPSPVAIAPVAVATPAPSAPSVDTSSWKAPRAANAGRRTRSPRRSAPAAAAPPGSGTVLPRVPVDAGWSDARPGTLLPSRRAAAPKRRIPAEIDGERLSPRLSQGEPGRAVGILFEYDGGSIRTRGSRYEVRVLSGDGESSELVAYLLGDPSELAPLVGRRIRAEGTVWWLRGVSSPVLQADSLSSVP